MPKKQMRKKTVINYAIVVFVAILFVAATIIAIIVTEGGRITKEGIIETGSVRLSVQPNSRNTAIYLNDKLVKPENNVINNIVPGEHTIRIESPQFHIWEKQVFVRPALVTNLEARLFPLEPELTQITQTNINKIVFSADGNYAYYVVTDPELPLNQQGLWSMKLDEQEIFFRRGFSPDKVADVNDPVFDILNSEDIEVFPDTSNDKLLIVSNSIGKTFVFDPKQSNPLEQIVDVTAKVGFQPDKVSWFNNNNSLIMSNSEILLELNLVNEEKTLISYTSESKPIYISNGSVLFLYQPIDRKLFLYQNKLLKEQSFIGIVLPEGISEMQVSTNAKSLVLSSNTEHYYFDLDVPQLKLLHRNSKLVDFSFDGSTAIFNENGTIVTATIEKLVISKDLVIKISNTDINPDHHPHFINNSNLIVFNNETESKLQVSENDGSNIVSIVENTDIINGYFAFQKSGSSVVVLIEDENDDNILNTNLFKLNFGGGILPFNL